MLSTGDINRKYEIIGLIGGLVDNQDSVQTSTCMGAGTAPVSHDAMTTYARGEDLLLRQARQRGGNGVIFARFDYRIAVQTLGKSSRQVQELFCYGTAVKFSTSPRVSDAPTASE